MPLWCCLLALILWLNTASASTVDRQDVTTHSLTTKLTRSQTADINNNSVIPDATPTTSDSSFIDTTVSPLNDTKPAFNSSSSKVNDSIDAKCPTLCQCDPYFNHVDCSNSTLTDIPSAIPSQVHLLGLDNNHLLNLPYLGHLPHLQTLNLQSNNLKAIASDAFSGTPSLHQLNLHGNLLNKSVESPFADSLFAHLAVLNVSNNGFTNWPYRPCTNNSKLKILDISNNQLISFPKLEMHHSLQFLFLQQNSIVNLTHSDESLNGSFEINSTETNASIPCYKGMLDYPSFILLNLSHNNIVHIDTGFFNAFTVLEKLDLSYNMLQSVAFFHETQLTNLSQLILSHNSIFHLANNIFLGCPNLRSLHLSHMTSLTHINSNSFTGLDNLEELYMDHSASLHYIHASALSHLVSLQILDMSFTDIQSLHPSTFKNESKGIGYSGLKVLNLQGLDLQCSCNTAWLQNWSMLNSSTLIPSNLTCSGILHDNTSLSNTAISEFPFELLNCTGASIEKVNEQLFSYKIGSSALFNCHVNGEPSPYIKWLTPRKHVFTYHPSFIDHSELEPEDDEFHNRHYWHNDKTYYHGVPYDKRIYVLKNGSLYIDYITRRDAGKYHCTASNHLGNETMLITMMLDYSIIIETRMWCAIVGVGSAISFLILGLTTGIIRWVAHFCSREEREKRRSIRELLIQIQEYKTEKVDVIRAYKTAKLDKISAFKNHKIDKLRLYKQSTVTNILAYMHSMREHYQVQMSRVKDNYTEQTGKLRDNYTAHVTRMKDYRSEKIERLRENYQSQALRLRDYGSAQMQRLREQYKVQQQHLLKLLELLDVGNCMSVIEAECMRTESIIFDPNIMFDLDAPKPPVHGDFVSPLSEDSEYITAGSRSDLSCASTLGQQPMKELFNKPTEIKSDRVKRRKRRRHYSAHVHNSPAWIDSTSRDSKTHESSPEQEGLPPFKTEKPHRKRKKCKPSKAKIYREVQSDTAEREDSDTPNAKDSTDECVRKDSDVKPECVVIMCDDSKTGEGETCV